MDVGANKGTWTYAMKSAVGRTGLVLAIEPQVDLAEYLRKGLVRGRSRSVEVLCVAASEISGEAVLKIPEVEGKKVRGHASLESTSVGGSHQSVSTLRLDDLLCDRKPSFIKIDVEGHEFAVLRGAEQILRRSQPALVVEMTDYSKTGSSAQCFELLCGDYSYKAATLKARELVRLHSWPPPHVLGTPNVIFAHELP